MFLEAEDFAGARILAVDDNPLNLELLCGNLEKSGYEVVRAESGEEALEELAKADFDLVLLDVMMPGISGFEVCERIKQNPHTHLLPVVLVTALDGTADRVKGISAGADDFVSKPFDRAELMARTKACIRTKRLTDQLETSDTLIVALANAIEAKDSYTEGHAGRVAHYAVEIGRQMGYDVAGLRKLRLGGLLHDIGKIGVPEEVLNKPGPLDDEEWLVMKKHPEIGDKICRPLRSLQDVLPMIRSHHERPDGSGYPDGLVGDATPMEARIVCLADIYDALATTRSYKKSFSRERCLEILHEDANKNRLDKDVVAAFERYLMSREAAKRA